jgi:V8-like Glu-specific endopeptidase
MTPLIIPLITSTLALVAVSAVAQSSDVGDGLENLSPSRVLNNQQGRYDHWKGIGRLQSEGGRACTATLIDTRTSADTATGPAYVLTSGHCLYRKNSSVILADQPLSGSVTFNYFADTLAQQQPYPLKHVNWSSMQGVDLAVIELDATLDTLMEAGIQPLQMAEDAPEAGTDILVVGAPLPFPAPYLRMAACTQQTSGEVIEQPWVWRHTVKNQCKDIEAGSSGSPLLIRDSNQLFAVINTTTLATEGQTLELVPSAETTRSDLDGNFGNPISYLRPCFVEGKFTSDPETCPLFPTFSLEFSNSVARYAKVKLGEDGNEIYPHWNAAFSIDKPFYRYKTVRQARLCETPDYYSPAIKSEDARIETQIGPEVGVHMLCILGVDSTEERPSPGLMRNALTLAVELQAPSDPSPPQVQISQRFRSYSINWKFDQRLISHQTFKLGPVESTNCNDSTGYKPAWRKVTVPPEKLPLKVCTYAYDHADQPSQVREDLLVAREAEPGEKPAKRPATNILRIGID